MAKIITLAAALPATAEQLFDMYLDPEAHAAFTGAPVTISPRPGASFRAFDGVLSGTLLWVDPKRQIVQTWRSASWSAEDPDSILILGFRPEGESARIELVHVNVPDSDFAGVSQGWEKFYWTPWRAYLSDRDPG